MSEKKIKNENLKRLENIVKKRIEKNVNAKMQKPILFEDDAARHGIRNEITDRSERDPVKENIEKTMHESMKGNINKTTDEVMKDNGDRNQNQVRKQILEEEIQDEIKEERKALLKGGCFLGLILSASTGVAFSIQNNKDAVLELLPWFVPILTGYLLAGIFIVWLYTRPRKSKFQISNYVKGISSVYWSEIVIGAFLLMAGMIVTEKYMFAFIMNCVVLAAAWFLNYFSMMRLSKELNRHIWQKQHILLWDIEECPKNREEFFTEIEKYAAKNHKSLKFIERTNPAIVELDGVHHLVTIQQSYSKFGLLYSLKFKELTD